MRILMMETPKEFQILCCDQQMVRGRLGNSPWVTSGWVTARSTAILLFFLRILAVTWQAPPVHLGSSHTFDGQITSPDGISPTSKAGTNACKRQLCRPPVVVGLTVSIPVWNRPRILRGRRWGWGRPCASEVRGISHLYSLTIPSVLVTP